MHDAGVAEGNIPLVVDPSRGYRAANLELVQGAYYFATGAWPLISPSTFQAVSAAGRRPQEARRDTNSIQHGSMAIEG